MKLTPISSTKCFGGKQATYSHESTYCKTTMRFAIFLPKQAEQSKVPVLWFLSGLTCTEENATIKAGAQRYASEHGIALIMPDTSPRDTFIKNESSEYDFGSGASFYVDAIKVPWSKNYQMYSYLIDELQSLIRENFPLDMKRQGITGHSMGGHGALTIGLKHPDIFQSISAFAPICAPTQCPWGQKAFLGYLGEDTRYWDEYDATALILSGKKSGEILIDQGSKDEFLSEQLKPELFAVACETRKQPLNLRLQNGYDHSYFFIASFMEDHIKFHANRLFA